MLRLLCAAVALLLTWHSPAHASLLAQGGQSMPVADYGVGLGAMALVLLVVCWPAHRHQE